MTRIKARRQAEKTRKYWEEEREYWEEEREYWERELYLPFSVLTGYLLGLGEEIVFRSIIRTRLSEAFRLPEGTLPASLLFGLMHSGVRHPLRSALLSIVGLLIGFMFHKTRSIPLIAMTRGFMNAFLFGIILHLDPRLGLFKEKMNATCNSPDSLTSQKSPRAFISLPG